jgi:hypothetical protein
MYTFHNWMLIRELVVLGTLALMVIAGVLLARLRTRCPATTDRSSATDSDDRPAVLQRSLRYPINGMRAQANDADASAHGVPRRAA